MVVDMKTYKFSLEQIYKDLGFSFNPNKSYTPTETKPKGKRMRFSAVIGEDFIACYKNEGRRIMMPLLTVKCAETGELITNHIDVPIFKAFKISRKAGLKIEFSARITEDLQLSHFTKVTVIKNQR